MKNFQETEFSIPLSRIKMKSDLNLCQTDYPLDWYQEDFIPYAEEFQALPDRELTTVLKWMEGYMRPAIHHFGDHLLLLAHYYMGGEIVNLIEHFGGEVADSYQLALKARNHPEKKIIVESAVHFMAESISILAHPDQKVYITNPKAGCTMEMHAKDYMVEPAILDLNTRYGEKNILPISYMNTSGRIKALTGAQGGSVCTSSNVKKIFEWALAQNKKILFIPDQYMGENVASWVGIAPEEIAYWPGGEEGANYSLMTQNPETIAQFDRAKLVLFCSECAVHSYMRKEMVLYWKDRGYSVVVHPECRKEVVDVAHGCGSTAFLWDYVTKDRGHTRKYAVGTENHMVKNLRRVCQASGIEIVHVADAPLTGFKGMGCGCATMSRNDPPHLVGLLDLLRQGKDLAQNGVMPGDVVNEFTGQRQRLDAPGQAWIIENARIALENMIQITGS